MESWQVQWLDKNSGDWIWNAYAEVRIVQKIAADESKPVSMVHQQGELCSSFGGKELKTYLPVQC
jgi:hypothetical protein